MNELRAKDGAAGVCARLRAAMTRVKEEVRWRLRRPRRELWVSPLRSFAPRAATFRGLTPTARRFRRCTAKGFSGRRSVMASLLLFISACSAVHAEGSKVSFNDDGIALVDGKPFFPIGVFTYEITPEVLAELREVRANVVLNGFKPDQLDLLDQHGLMAVCPPAPEWIKAAKDHPALLAWYLTDEPENRGIAPEAEQKNY